MDFLPFDIIRCIAMDLATTVKLRQLNRKFNYIVSSNWLHYKQTTPFTHNELVNCIIERLRTKQKIQLSYISKNKSRCVYFKRIEAVLYICDPKTTKNNYHRVYVNTRKYLNKWCKKRSNARPPLTSVLTTLEKRNISRAHTAKLAMQEIVQSIENQGVPMWRCLAYQLTYITEEEYDMDFCNNWDSIFEGYLHTRIRDIQYGEIENNFSPMHLRQALTESYMVYENIVYIRYICKIYEAGYIPRAVILTQDQMKQTILEMIQENQNGCLGARDPKLKSSNNT